VRRVLDPVGHGVLGSGATVERDANLLAEDEDPEREARLGVDEERRVEVSRRGAARDGASAQPGLPAETAGELEERRRRRRPRDQRGDHERRGASRRDECP
jgi:hypothetical protein